MYGLEEAAAHGVTTIGDGKNVLENAVGTMFG